MSIPPEVLAQYQSVNANAQQAAATPFQTYSTSPNAFVAPLNDTQQAGINDTNAAAGQAQGYYLDAAQQQNNAYNTAQPYNANAQTALTGATASAAPLQSSAANNYQSAYNTAQPYQQGATSAALAGGQAVNPTTLDSAAINQYLSPYLGDVLGSESALLNQNNQQQQAGQLGSAISSGAFGGDRAGIAAANLAQQQNLSNASIYSGILNTGYNTALSTAQQQQDVGLGAAQANRTAQQNEASQLASIGEQGYTQGMGLGSAQASLGNQEYTQGANTAAQEAALGNQVFGQGTTNSQNIAGLGTAAQTANLQGAQAQLAAGQVQQTTQQAGDTALYNQFLQQQSYPFQTAQFLANIAEGTGSLSGSTTTTQQPGGFFSDERLKEDIKPIGKTYDGQQIYSYKYKGDPRTQIGLMAQEVKKKHPDAVGLAGGYGTVDYSLATRQAAKRGHFAGGGVAGFDPETMAAILQSAQGMYGPTIAGGGSQAGSVPYGGSSRVPAANVPVGHLMTAGPMPAHQSGLQQVSQIANLGTTLEKGAQGLGSAANWAKSHLDLGDPLPDYSNTGVEAAPGAKRGGLVARRYASGGAADDTDDMMPYSDQVGGLQIPDQHPNLKLATAGSLPGQQSGLGQLGSLASTASGVASLGGDIAKGVGAVLPFLGLARGGVAGRHGYDDGGDVAPDDSLADFATAPPDVPVVVSGLAPPKAAPKPDFKSAVEQTLGFEGGYANGENAKYGINQKAHPDVDVPNLTLDQAKDIYKNQYWDKIGADNMSPDFAPVAFDTAVNLGPTAAAPMIAAANGDPSALLDARQAKYDALLKANPAKYGPDYKGWTNRTNALRQSIAQPAATPAIAAPAPADVGLGAAAVPNSDGPPSEAPAPSPTPMAAPTGGGLAPVTPMANTAPSHEHHGFLDSLKDPQNFIPILSGIAAMGTAPTRSLGVALASGLGAGAQSYQAQRQFGLEQQATGQNQLKLGIAQYGAQTQRQLANNQTTKTGVDVIDKFTSMFTPVADPNNKSQILGYRNLTNGQIVDPTTYQNYILNLAKSVGPDTGSVIANAANTMPGGKPAASAIAAPSGGPPTPAAPAVPGGAVSPSAPPSLPTGAPVADDQLNKLNAARQDALNTAVTGATPEARTAAAATAEGLQQQIAARTSYLNGVGEANVGLQNSMRGKTFDTQIAAKNSAYEGFNDAQDTLNNAKAALNVLIDPKTGKPTVSGGPLGEHLSQFGALAEQVGFDPKFVQEWLHTDPNNAAELKKLQVGLGSQMARLNMAGSPVRVSEFEHFLGTVPGSEMPTQAALWVLQHSVIPQANARVGAYQAVRNLDPTKDDVQGALATYRTKNPWFTPTPAAAPASKAPAGASLQQLQAEAARRKAAQGAP